jgi:hypothetical protein
MEAQGHPLCLGSGARPRKVLSKLAERVTKHGPRSLESLCGCKPIHQPEEFVVVLYGTLIKRHDEGTTIRFDRHPTLLLERYECLPHGDSADAKRAGDIVLMNSSARGEKPVEDQPSNIERSFFTAAAPAKSRLWI